MELEAKTRELGQITGLIGALVGSTRTQFFPRGYDGEVPHEALEDGGCYINQCDDEVVTFLEVVIPADFFEIYDVGEHRKWGVDFSTVDSAVGEVDTKDTVFKLDPETNKVMIQPTDGSFGYTMALTGWENIRETPQLPFEYEVSADAEVSSIGDATRIAGLVNTAIRVSVEESDGQQELMFRGSGDTDDSFKRASTQITKYDSDLDEVSTLIAKEKINSISSQLPSENIVEVMLNAELQNKSGAEPGGDYPMCIKGMLDGGVEINTTIAAIDE